MCLRFSNVGRYSNLTLTFNYFHRSYRHAHTQGSITFNLTDNRIKIEIVVVFRRVSEFTGDPITLQTP